jgi:hypothetical protein
MSPTNVSATAPAPPAAGRAGRAGRKCFFIARMISSSLAPDVR